MRIIKFLAVLILILNFSPFNNAYATTEVSKPTIESINVDKKEATVGDTIKVSVKIKEYQDIRYLNLEYKSPITNRYITVRLNFNNETKSFEGSIPITNYTESGDYKPFRLSLYGSSITSISSWESDEFDNGGFRINGTSGSELIESISVNKKEVTVGDKVKVSLKVADPQGISYLNASYTYPVTNQTLNVSLSYNPETNAFEGNIPITSIFESGTYKLFRVTKYEKGDVTASFYNGYYPEKFKNGDFNVNGIHPVNIIESITVDKQEATVGDTINIAIKSSESLYYLYYSSPKNNQTYTVDLYYNSQTKLFEGSFIVPDNSDSGTYTLIQIGLHDAFGNSTSLLKSEYFDQFELGNFSVLRDNTAPITTAINVPTYWTHKDVSITLSAADENSDVAKTEYRINNGEWTEYNGALNLIEEGKNVVDYRSVDNTGNVEETKSFKVDIDKTAPETIITLIQDNWYNSDVTLKLESSDSLSGVAKTIYKVNDGDWITFNNGINVSNEGINKVQYRSIDNAGNVEETKSVEAKIDKTAPTLNVSFDQSVITDRNHQLVPINASVEADDNLSGVASYELVSIVSNQQDNGKGDGNTTQDIQGAEFGTPDTNFLVRAEGSGSGDRVYTVTYKVTDNAGNTVTTSQDIVVKHDNSKK